LGDLHKHVNGVGQLVLEIGRHFSLDPEQLDELMRAAELHDIGKLAVPRRDPQQARPLARLVRASHERWDGNGYPGRLAGRSIPLGARIIAACDAFDAMSSDRCDQTARSTTEAIAELQHNAGTQFDPVIINALFKRPDTAEPKLEGENDDAYGA
jgi:HD-GYP domain-containing protein (c-di-GMP phosphodiesterase class II)